MKCLIYEMSYLWNVLSINVLSMKCPIYEKSYLWNVFLYNIILWNFFLWNIFLWNIFPWNILLWSIFVWNIFQWNIFLWNIFLWNIFFVIFSYEMSQRPFINPFINKMVWKHLFWQTNIFKERRGWVLLTTYKHIASIFTKNLNLNAIINCKVQNKTYIFLNKIDLNLHNCTKWIKNNNAWNKLLRLNLNLFICRLFHSYFFIREILNFINLWIQ